MKQVWKNFNAVLDADSGHFPPISTLPEKEVFAPLPKQFTLLVWNIYKGLGGEQFEQDLTDLDARTHISCLQEVLAEGDPNLPRCIGLQNSHYGISYKRQDGLFEGVLSASRYKLLEDCVAIKSIGREPITKTPKTALVSFVEVENGQTLLLINIHMLLFKRASQFYKELKCVFKVCEKYRHYPAIFCGDFNTFLPWQLLLLDAVLKREGFYRCKPEYRPRGSRYLDHVYARGLRLVELQIVDTISSSDHFPLLCEFTI
ncbi:MAG: hypothetical protein KAG18_00045 [Sinobacterium sp.]|nr:hypothetical protein [Sinobacterium sp.]